MKEEVEVIKPRRILQKLSSDAAAQMEHGSEQNCSSALTGPNRPLSNRTCTSECPDLNYGVPQGSTLSPSLFKSHILLLDDDLVTHSWTEPEPGLGYIWTSLQVCLQLKSGASFHFVGTKQRS